MNLVEHLLTWGRDAKAVSKVERWLAKPDPSGTRPSTDDRSSWSPTSEMDAFAAAMGTVASTQRG